jgi:DNA-binding NarL/FixJ family response regulator
LKSTNKGTQRPTNNIEKYHYGTKIVLNQVGLIKLPIFLDMRSLELLVADDHPIFVEGLQTVFAKASQKYAFHIKGVARTGAQVSDLLRDNHPDLLLLDLNLPETDSLKMLPGVKKGHSNLRVLVMTSSDDPRMVKAALRAGADAYLLKSGSKDELFTAIDEVLDGHTFVGKGIAFSDSRAAIGGEAGLPDKHFARKYGLTKREIEIMRYIGQALSNKDIAESLFISDQTVSVHRKNIMRKLGVNNTASLIKIAFEHHLV